MKVIYKFMDMIFDPDSNAANGVKDDEFQDESYERYKLNCYRQLIVKTCATFVLGMVCAALLHLMAV